MARTANAGAAVTPLQAHGGLAVLTGYVLIAPLALSNPYSVPGIAVQAAFHLMLVLLVIGVAAHRIQLVACITLVAGATLTRILASSDAASVQAAADLMLVACGTVALWMAVRRVLHTRAVTAALISAAIGVYLLCGIVWSVGFHALETIQPGSIISNTSPNPVSADDLHYFSFVTLTTLGYGDLSPASAIARSLATAEALFGQLFLVVLLGRVVSLQIAAQPNNEPHAGMDGAGQTGSNTDQESAP
ncbi:MAG: potassium channel family protein [Planctomycetota bacterium]